METVTVRILEGGRTCREINPYGEKPFVYRTKMRQLLKNDKRFQKTNKDLHEWQEAENKLRTWEVANVEYHAGNPLVYVFDKDANGKIFKLLEPEETFKAQIINGKAVIV